MKRDVNVLLMQLGRRNGQSPDTLRVAVGLPIGPEGGYFVGGAGFAGQHPESSILDKNKPPLGQPGLWCKWTPSDDRRSIEWNGHEKFYDYTAWLEYLVAHFLKPWGYVLDGEVEWQGEQEDDKGTLVVINNHVHALGVGAELERLGLLKEER